MTKIIGQEKLIKEVHKIFDIFKASEGEIKPHFILTGPSGTGKSFVINNLTKEKQLGFVSINAAQLTKEGTSGNSLSKALTPLINMQQQLTVVFVDEFDKLFISGNSNDIEAHESTTGVQNEFLKVLENDTTNVFSDYGKYAQINISKVLFIFAGAFNGEENIDIDRLRQIGLKTEFLGRVGLVYNTETISLNHLLQILNNSPLLNKYCEVFADANKETAIEVISEHITKHYQLNTLGARMINTLINQYFIKGGKLNAEQVKEVTFQKKLSFNS